MSFNFQLFRFSAHFQSRKCLRPRSISNPIPFKDNRHCFRINFVTQLFSPGLIRAAMSRGEVYYFAILNDGLLLANKYGNIITC